MTKDQVAETLANIGILLDLKGENPFKVRAYSNAARAIETLTEPIDRLVAEGRLGEIRGLGESMQAKIVELVTKGTSEYYETLKGSVPAGMVQMLEIAGMGPKKIKLLHDQLGIQDIEQLEKACREGRIAGLKGFGAKTQTNILEGIVRYRTYASRHLLADALPLAEELLEMLRGCPEVIRCSTAGSLRRAREIIGDVDLLASSKNPSAVLDFFVSKSGVAKILAKGETKASVLLEGGIQSDLRVVSDAEYPFALLYFTGSKEHNIVMRQRAIDRGLRLNEYGLFRSQAETRDPALREACVSEEEVFERLGLSFIPPEMREDHGEFSLADNDSIPRLIEWTDLKGSLHNHSTWSDGRQSPEEIALSMMELGLSYWGVTDHSKASFQANGLDVARVRRQIKEVEKINERLAGEGSSFRLFTGTEVDILKNGKLDFPDDLLAELDIVIASIHQSFSGTEAEMTARLVGAAQNPYVHMLGHLTGRLLLEREPYEVNQHEVIEACAQTGTWIELNASPSRLDMDWRLWPFAKSKGVKCVINCDAHRAEHAGFLRIGASIARKAGLTRQDVINTLPVNKLIESLQAKRSRTRL